MKLTPLYSGLLVLLLFSFSKCSDEVINENNYTPLNKYQEGEELAIGKFTSQFLNNDAFGIKIPGLDRTGDIKFFVGDRLFMTTWVPSPASTTGLDGLGPTFNAKSCSSCHFKDGRGRPLNVSTLNSTGGFLMRISIPGKDEHGGPKPVPHYGNQIQDKSLFRVPTEAQVKVNYTYIDGKYPDGTKYQLQKPNYTIFDEKFGSLQDVLTSPRVGNQTIGLGFVDALTEKEILKNADEFDKDNDGISGKANYVWNIEQNKITIGKFGWKANAPSIKQQVAGAFHGDMGLTSSLFPKNNCPSPQDDCNNRPNGGTPEVTDTQLDQIVFYQSTLSVPVRRNYKNKEVLEGKKLFHELNCIACHQTNFKTQENYQKIPLISNTTIHPYSDFLLHDMGEELADNRPDFLANGREWRTQPLWGVGMIQNVNKHTNLLHDGRARNIEEAILWHGGEAEKSKQEFMKLQKSQREQVLKFVNSL